MLIWIELKFSRDYWNIWKAYEHRFNIPYRWKKYLYEKIRMEEVIPIINKTKIDRLVYEFYGLTEEEIRIGETSMSKELGMGNEKV